jgi:large subunit ribosomal protein L18
MNVENLKKQKNKIHRKLRIRSRVIGTAERPRASVNISNIHVSVQVINDQTNETLVAYSSVGKKLKGNMTEKAVTVGKEVAKLCGASKIDKVVFDRSGKKYHGRVKALAEAMREGGLEF